MNANLLRLCQDALLAVRLRYRPAEDYVYGLPVFLAVMLGIGMVDAVGMRPILGGSPGALSFGILMGITRWLVYTRALAEMLRQPNGQRIPFLGYTLATEALSIPVLFFVPFAEAQPLVGLWVSWTTLAQFIGVVVISRRRPLRVLLAYAVYLVAMVLLGRLFFNWFAAAGWLDADAVMQNLLKIVKMPEN